MARSYASRLQPVGGGWARRSATAAFELVELSIVPAGKRRARRTWSPTFGLFAGQAASCGAPRRGVRLAGAGRLRGNQRSDSVAGAEVRQPPAGPAVAALEVERGQERLTNGRARRGAVGQSARNPSGTVDRRHPESGSTRSGVGRDGPARVRRG